MTVVAGWMKKEEEVREEEKDEGGRGRV